MQDIYRKRKAIVDLRPVAQTSRAVSPASRLARFASSTGRFLLAVVIATGLFAFVSNAGSIGAPGGAPAAVSYTLSDIYAQLKDGTAATAGNHSLSPTTTPQASFHSLSDIYNAAVSLRASSVSLTNMFNGSCDNEDTCPNGNEFPGASQASGGVDDFNWNYTATTTPLQAAPGRYETTWTQCDVGNNYCGTGDTNADAKDEATGLVWSYLCTGLGCATFDTAPIFDVLGDQNDPLYYWNADTYYTWDNSGADNDGKTAAELCSAHSGWYLPHQKQLMQAYINGSYGNLDPLGVDRYYWSATTRSYGTAGAWDVDLANGYTYYYGKTGTNSVRCVRPAI